MQLIDIGDLTLSIGSSSKQEKLYHSIREKIVKQLWPNGAKLPSTRKMAEELSLSRNTVIAAYEQLTAEGYIESKSGSGFYIAVELPEHFLPTSVNTVKPITAQSPFDINNAFAPGVPDLAQFPHSKWHTYIHRHASRRSLLGNQDIQGLVELRTALSGYLSSSRSVSCAPHRIIITSGAQQALSIALMATLSQRDGILLEQPGYTQMSKIMTLLGYEFHPLPVKETSGIDLNVVFNSDAKALYVTPSNQYPMGTTLNIEQRLKLIEWASHNKRWIIEDDYDSEFQFAHRPYTSLQGLAGQIKQDNNVIYIGSFSKVMFNSLRIGYLVVPEFLVPKCLAIKDAMTGDTPAHIQAALADFIIEGALLRHIRKMRRLYKEKHQRMLEAIEKHFGIHVSVISQAAGLHVTLKWYEGIDETTLAENAKQAGITVRPLSYYEQNKHHNRDWHGVVLGFGNVSIKDIEPKMQTLSDLFDNT